MPADTPIRASGGSGSPPRTPAEVPVDEGPMRRELLRQIALLDADLAARSEGWGTVRVTPRRGPALQPTAVLERIRDELLTALDRASHR
ncbi:MAG: hypothetical protein JWN32_1847 [Solirubrobacterales bacterium]|jgi:hypothetical protein|nr:hypothetical protein [Solirubrobacterales bacterium]